MVEKDINAEAKTEVQESPAVAIDGYKEVAKGGSKFWDKAKYHVIRAGVILGATAATIGVSKADFNSKEYKIGAMAASGLVGLAIATSIKNYKDDDKTADFTKYTGRE
ncbi:MAG: hypothetical protein J6Y53_01050 [Alphaproteobacteria bacterium]|nr:hypothetical protein [Alphaproteobacteria bacterium]